MFDEYEEKAKVLQDLMDHMRHLDGSKLKPKAVEVSVEAIKPKEAIEIGGEPSVHGLDMQGAQPGLSHSEPDGDEDLSPEDMAVLDSLFGDKEEERE